MRIGVLALQGAVSEHMRMLREVGAEPVQVKRRDELASIAGLIIPGGESTAIGLLMEEYGIADELRRDQIPIFGTCAGMILLAKDISRSDQPRLGLMDITVERNAYGRQRESFEGEVEVPGITGGPVHGVFIRAPYATRVGGAVEVLGSLDGKVVVCRQGHHLASAFHPELTDDPRLHRYFVQEVAGQRSEAP